MKKRLLSILLILCMVLALCPVTAFADTGDKLYSLTLNFKYGTLDGQTGSYVLQSDGRPGEPYDVTYILLDDITGYEPYKIVGVRSDTGDGERGWFTDHDIVLEVVYEVEGSLAITVDGFMPGNTPNDCTVTVESTIPGVTFDEKDIKHLRWGILWAGQWKPINETEAFEAGTSYRFDISLKNNGLELVPATTANGIAPMYRQVVSYNGVPYAIDMEFEFGTPPEPAPAITIHGPDVVCAEQDYEFSVTTADGANFNDNFVHDPDDPGFGYGYVGYLTRDEDGVGHGVVSASEYGDADSMVLTVSGTSANGKVAGATKTVQISKEHLFVDGVCGCGAVQQYTITYDGGEGVEGSIPSGVKTHGVDFTLSSETFTWDGFVQTGWIDKEGAIYDLGGVYTLDEDMTFSPYWEKIITLTVPYTTTVALGDVGVPGEKTFTLALIGDSAPDLDKSNVTVSGSVTTNGKGSYNGTLTITGPEGTLWVMLSEGAFVQQVDDGEAGWTVDDTVWGVLMEEIPVAYAVGDDAVASKYTVYAVPASIDGQGNYTIDWENLQTADMTFTNTYTAHVHDFAQKFNESEHWDECDCGAEQNREEHKYGDWTVTKAATEAEEGQRERICTVCDYKQTESIPKLVHTHDFAQKFNESEHWDECTCGAEQNREEHQYGEWTVTKAATEAEEGQQERICTVCDYKQTESIPKLVHTHDFAQKFNETEHWDECACGAEQNREEHQYGQWIVTKAATEAEEGQRERICTVCDYKQTESIPKLVHTHDYEQKFDADGHWDECGCGAEQNREEHKYGDWTVTKAATEAEEGQRERICTVCDYKQTESIPKLVHTHDYEQKFDADGHWDECGCGDVQNKEAHKFGQWTVTKKATETAKGEKERTCTVCGYTEKAAIAKLGTVATGDDSNFALWFALLAVSAAAVITTAAVSKKKKANR